MLSQPRDDVQACRGQALIGKPEHARPESELPPSDVDGDAREEIKKERHASTWHRRLKHIKQAK